MRLRWTKVALEKLPKAKRWLQHVEGAFSHPAAASMDPAAAEVERGLGSLIRGNLWWHILQDTCKLQPSVAKAAWQKGRLTVHAWST